MTKRQLGFWLMGILLIILTACGGAAADTTTTDIDINNLPDTVSADTVATIKDEPGVLVFDVREQSEYDEGHIPGVILIPMGEVPNRLSEIPTDQTVILTCRSGNRSGQVTEFLREQGYDNVHNMEGGIIAWSEAGLPVER
ncbi:MAG: rhodanese-like domain-containing protein [Candidatus Promineifilaceae bacterium]